MKPERRSDSADSCNRNQISNDHRFRIPSSVYNGQVD